MQTKIGSGERALGEIKTARIGEYFLTGEKKWHA
jgi:hypothetical protein